MQFFGFMRFSGWTCKSNRYFRNLFTLLQQRPSKAYAINCSCFPTGAKNTLFKQKRKNELKNKSSTTAFPCYSEFTCAILSISSISRLTIAYMGSIGVGAVCILVTRVVSFTLVNVYEITDKKLCKIAVHKPLPCLRVQAIAVFNLLLDCENARLSYLIKKVVYAETYLLITFSQITVSPILNN